MATRGPRTRAASPYDVHPGVMMVQQWAGELKEKTGRTLDEWVEFVQRSGPKSDKARSDWLKNVHGHNGRAAEWIVARAGPPAAFGFHDDDPESYLSSAAHWVEEMYAGAKASLRPIHDRLIALGRALGPDVKVCPCQTMVPLYRQHVIAQIKASTRTRVDFGLALKGAKGRLPKRLIDTGGLEKKDRITHRFALSSAAEIDDEVERWLRVAYDLDA